MRAGLVCVFGMSTYYVLRAVEKAVQARGVDVTLEAIPVAELPNRIGALDLVLIGPQVRFKHDQVAKIAAAAQRPVISIPSELYGMMDGEKVLDLILAAGPANA